MTTARQKVTHPPSLVMRGWWWALDYAYAARRQFAIVTAPWTLGRPRPAPRAWRKGSDDLAEIVLLPGVYEHWTFLRPLGDALAAAGHRVHVVHGLGVNRRSIPDTADRLVQILSETPSPPCGRVLVAHSKGGLIGKLALVSSGATIQLADPPALGGDPPVSLPPADGIGAVHGVSGLASPAASSVETHPLGLRGLVAVATPFGGARRARYLFADPSIRAFLPADETIMMLGRETSINGRIVSVFGSYDPHIPEGSALDGATNVEVPAPGHFRVLAAPSTVRAVLDAIALLAPGGLAAP